MFVYNTKVDAFGATTGIIKQQGSAVNTNNFDTLALKYYGRPDLFWVIGQYNHINDPYIKLSDKTRTTVEDILDKIRGKLMEDN